MIEDGIRALVEFRIEQARNCLANAEISVEADFYKDAANRSYYCIFHCMRTVLALDKFDSKKHSGIIAAFRQKYIKTGKFAPEFSDIIGDAFEVRNLSDYEDFYVVSKADALQQIDDARAFLEVVQNFINSILEAGGTK